MFWYKSGGKPKAEPFNLADFYFDFPPQGVVLRQSQEPKELWGYVQVRNKAHMFWWLYYANNPTKAFTELPLILWLQVRFGERHLNDNSFHLCLVQSDRYLAALQK